MRSKATNSTAVGHRALSGTVPLYGPTWHGANRGADRLHGVDQRGTGTGKELIAEAIH